MSRYSLFAAVVLLSCLTLASDAEDGRPANRSRNNPFSIKGFSPEALTGIKADDLKQLVKKQEEEFKRTTRDVTRSVKDQLNLEGEAAKLRRATADKMKSTANQFRQQQMQRIRQLNTVFDLRQESERLVQDLSAMDHKLVDSNVKLEKSQEDLKAKEEEARRQAELFESEKKLLLLQEQLLTVQIDNASKAKAKWFYGFLITLATGGAGLLASFLKVVWTRAEIKKLRRQSAENSTLLHREAA